MKGPRIFAIIRADLRGLGDDYIKERMEVTSAQLTRIRSSELYKQRLADLQNRADDMALDKVEEEGDQVAAVLNGAALAAAETNVALLESADVKIQQSSAWDILDRTGHPKATRTEVRQKQAIVIDTDSLKALGEALTAPSLVPDEEGACSMESEAGDGSHCKTQCEMYCETKDGG